ncbi:MAG: site-2 protease family protein [Nitrososphaerota archaeon]|nr:site-2 protease family protein [Nitrososphaerota archaeon]MDG7026479.1 site-2 protease family protein [Nitrososphaerota archaeon]
MAIQLGRIAGIPVAVDYSLLVIFALIAWSVGYVLMPTQYPGLAGWAYLAIGVLSAFLLFASILVHELAHSVVARSSGLKIRKITLYLLGGVSEIEGEPTSPSVELKVAAAGPLASVALTAVFALLWLLSAYLGAPALVSAPLEYTGVVNGAVAVFNLLPAFPMDGGRILRAIVWRRKGDLLASTRTAAAVGRVFAYLIMLGGMFLVVFVDVVLGVWFFIIGWFISSGAQAALTQTALSESLRGTRVRDIMTKKLDSVTPEMTLEEVSQRVLILKHNGFPVISEEKLVGCITMHDLRRVKRESWPQVEVREAMTARASLFTVEEADPASKVVALMNANRVGRIFVVSGDGSTLAGMVTRSDVIKLVESREGVARNHLSQKISFTAERGMDFVIEQPVDPGLVWWAETPRGARLLAEGTDTTGGGHEVERFTFQAVESGRLAIRLLEGPRGAGGPVVRTVAYTVDVE